MEIKLFTHFKLRPLQDADLKNLVAHINYPEVSQNTTNIPHPYSDEDGLNFLSRFKANEGIDFSKTVFAIHKEGTGLIGAIGLHHYPHYAAHRREIGYWIGKDYWGQGIPTEAVKALCNWALEHTEVKRIDAFVYNFNPASKRVLEKAGFENEGLLKKLHFKNGKFIDTFLLSRIG